MSAENWHARTTNHLTEIRAGILDLIDCGDTNAPHPLRAPTDTEVVSTRRGANEDRDYATPESPKGTRSEPSDPVRKAIERREHAIMSALTKLHSLVDEWTATVPVSLQQWGLDVYDEHNRPLAAPEPPPTIRGRYGQTLVAIPLSDAAWNVNVACAWMLYVADAVAERWRTKPTDVDQLLEDRMHHLATRTAHLARTEGRDTQAARGNRCANPHGIINHPRGPEDINGVCKRCAADLCAAEHRRCRNPRSSSDIDNGRRNCGACRTWASRNLLRLPTI